MYILSLTLCYICYLGLTRTEAFSPHCKYWFFFVSQGTSFYECKIGDIIQKAVSWLKIKQNRHIDLIIHELKLLNNLLMKTFYREVGQH